MPTQIRHIFLTGLPGVGKTTTILTAIDKLGREVVGGFFTREIRDENHERSGFEIVTLPSGAVNSTTGVLARLDGRQDTTVQLPNQIGRYVVNVEALEANACPALESVCGGNDNEKVKFVVLDEVGKMECLSGRFQDAIREVLNDRNTIVLGTIPTGNKVPLAAEVRERDDVLVLEVRKALSAEGTPSKNKYTRDALATKLAHVLEQILATKSAHNVIDSFFRNWLKDFLEPGQGRKLGLPASKPDPFVVQKSCGPLIADGKVFNAGKFTTVPQEHLLPPRALLLGEHGSPRPIDPRMAYNERSMWSVLDAVLEARLGSSDEAGVAGEQSVTPLSRPKHNTGHRHVRCVTARIAVWDVLATAHVRRSGKNNVSTYVGNDVVGLLRSYPSITRVVFIGEAAWRRFQKVNDKGVIVERVVCEMDDETNESKPATYIFPHLKAKAQRSKAEAKANEHNPYYKIPGEHWVKIKSKLMRRERRVAVDDRFVQVHVVRSARGGNKHDEYQDKVTQWTNALFGEKGEG